MVYFAFSLTPKEFCRNPSYRASKGQMKLGFSCLQVTSMAYLLLGVHN